MSYITNRMERSVLEVNSSKSLMKTMTSYFNYCDITHLGGVVLLHLDGHLLYFGFDRTVFRKGFIRSQHDHTSFCETTVHRYGLVRNERLHDILLI